MIFRNDPSRSVRSAVDDLLQNVLERCRVISGTSYAGKVLRYLVRAQLELMGPSIKPNYRRAPADADPHATQADFVVGDTAIHCTTSASDALIQKCQQNLNIGLHPIIIIYAKQTVVFECFAEGAGIADRIDILDATQFLTGNLYKLGRFDSVASRTKASDLVVRYNEIVAIYETDPSLLIEVV